RVSDLAVRVSADQLVLRERRAAPNAPGHGAPALVEPAVLVAALQEVPDVLDVVVGHGEVGVVPVHPLAEPDRLLRDDVGVGENPLTTALGEAVEPVLLDLALGVESKRLLDLDLDPESLAVEAILIALIEPLHRLVALVHVLVGTAPGMVDTHGVVR